MRHAARSPGRRRFLRGMTGMLLAPVVTRRQPSATSAPSGFASLDALQRDLPTLLERFAVPGAALGIVEKGSVTRAIGFGVRKTGTSDRVTGDTPFEAASLSKQPFAYLVLKLAELKRIDLDAPIGSFFREPDFRDDDTVDEITVRRVLAHQTGLLNWRPAREPQRFQFKPGGGFSYSGEAYVRLQRFIEKTTGASLTELTDKLFRDWKMPNSSFVWRPSFEATAAEGHDRNLAVVRTRLWGYGTAPQADTGPRGVDIPMFAVPNAAASLYSTAADYARFLQIVLAPPGADSSHLTRASLEQMFTPVGRVNDELSWGLGWGLARVNGVETIWQWGNNGVYQGFLVGAPRHQRGAVILTNSANGLRLAREIVSRLYGEEHPAFRWRNVLPPEQQ